MRKDWNKKVLGNVAYYKLWTAHQPLSLLLISYAKKEKINFCFFKSWTTKMRNTQTNDKMKKKVICYYDESDDRLDK